MNEKPYLADVQVGDRLYNFLEDNREYVVVSISKERNQIIARLSDLPQGARDECYDAVINIHGTTELDYTVPHFLYAPVDVLDPKNLPPRPWKPRKGEWVWAKRPKTGWVLAKFVSRNPHNEDYPYWCVLQEKPGKLAFSELAPFKGELPPGLEEKDKSNSKDKS